MLTNYKETPRRGSKYIAQGNTLGNKRPIIFALKGQKICCIRENEHTFALTGRVHRRCTYTQGVALGYVLTAPSGRLNSVCS